jgi:hypothetical protein
MTARNAIEGRASDEGGESGGLPSECNAIPHYDEQAASPTAGARR